MTDVPLDQTDQFLPQFNADGLIPVIAQDDQTKEVLMLAWMNKEALDRTLATGEAHYWSRSRQCLWHKGATSGSIQIVRALYYDCDQDALLILVDQKGGGACHTGEKSCFFRNYSNLGSGLIKSTI